MASFAALVSLALLAVDPVADTPIPLNGTCVARFASPEEGRNLLSQKDDYIAALSPFDRQAKTGSRERVDTQAFLEHAAQQALAWQPAERERLAGIVQRIAGKLAGLDLGLPPEVLLVQTTGREEANAAYSRAHAIVLPQSQLAQPDAELETLVTHELFHVVSRNNPELRQRLYAILGFQPCREVPLPADLAERRIANPDAPRLDCWVELSVAGTPLRCVPILLANGPYQPDRHPSFFSYLQFRLLVVEGEGDNLRPVLRNGQPVLLEPYATPDYFAHIGRNTGYIIHPEEVLADNFVFLVHGRTRLPNPEIPERMREAMTHPKK